MSAPLWYVTWPEVGAFTEGRPYMRLRLNLMPRLALTFDSQVVGNREHTGHLIRGHIG